METQDGWGDVNNYYHGRNFLFLFVQRCGFIAMLPGFKLTKALQNHKDYFLYLIQLAWFTVPLNEIPQKKMEGSDFCLSP